MMYSTCSTIPPTTERCMSLTVSQYLFLQRIPHNTKRLLRKRTEIDIQNSYHMRVAEFKIPWGNIDDVWKAFATDEDAAKLGQLVAENVNNVGNLYPKRFNEFLFEPSFMAKCYFHQGKRYVLLIAPACSRLSPQPTLPKGTSRQRAFQIAFFNNV